MTTVTLNEIDGFARSAAPEQHDPYSERALANALEEYLPRRPAPLARMRWIVGGREYPGLYQILRETDSSFGEVTIEAIGPPPSGPRWNFLVPFNRIEFHEDGSADLVSIEGEERRQRAIARVSVREHYAPRPVTHDEEASRGASEERYQTRLVTLQECIAFSRKFGLCPFSVAVLLYLPNERIRYELDVIDTTLLPDPRAGRFAPTRQVHRTSRVAWALDTYIAKSDLPLVSARALEILVESHGLTAVELSHVFGGVRELVDSSLQGLTARRLVTYDRRMGVYRPRLDAFLGALERPSSTESPVASANPALRTSVMELLAAADSRATCPLCGDPLPAGHAGIICDRCAAEMGPAA